MDRKVYAVDLATGAVLWSSRLSGLVAGGVLVSGDTVYAASSRPEGRVYALDRAHRQAALAEQDRTGRAPRSRSSAGTLIVSTQRGELLGLDPADGAIRWRRRMANGADRAGASRGRARSSWRPWTRSTG